MASSSTDTDAEHPPFVLNLWQTIDQAQSTHGVPHQDFGQYAAYCKARLTRLRHAAPVRATLVHNHKYVEGVSGRRHAYTPRETPERIHHINILYEVLYQSERAWATACLFQQLQQQQQQPSKSPHAHVQRRLNKAAKYAQELVELTERSCDETSIQEARAYRAWMQANAALEHLKHGAALKLYQECLTLLLQLSQQTPSDATPEVLARADIWTTHAETVVRPLVRFCRYQAPEAEVQETADATVESQTTKSTSSIVLEFRGKEIVLDPYQPLCVLHLKMESLLHQQSLDETHFLQLLTHLDDALRWTQHQASHYDSIAKAGPAVMAKRNELQLLQNYWQYQKLVVWRHQQEARMQDLCDDAERLHAYDALLQNAQQMAALANADTSSKDKEEDALWLEAQAHLLRVRAFRCCALAGWYETTLAGTPQQVLALLRHSKTLARRAMEEIAACDLAQDDAAVYLEALKELESDIAVRTCRAEAAWYVASQQALLSSTKTDRPLWLRLADLDAGETLVDDPPLTIPMPCKPAFYDVAWQYVGGDFDVEALDDYIAAHEQPKASGGVLGWFSRK